MLEDLMEVVKKIIYMATVITTVFITAVIGAGLVIGFANLVDYYLDQSSCEVYVDDALVYSGRTHYINVLSIGENGNSKQLTIHKDRTKLITKETYIDENIKVTNSGEDE